MSNIGRFRDRNPMICAAGKPCHVNMTLEEVLHEYKLVDKVDAIKHDLNIYHENQTTPYKLPKLAVLHHRGTHDRILHCWKNPVKTRYQELIHDLKETTYSSYWKTPLGKFRDPVPRLPEGMKYDEVTFGAPSVKTIPLQEVVNPPLSHFEVLRNSQVNHEQYKKIYHDYNVGEKITRDYKEPYDEGNGFGHQTKSDPSGARVRCNLYWFNADPVSAVSDRQASYWDRSHNKLGKVRTPVGNISSVPEGHRFGHRTARPMYGMEELLKPDFEPSLLKRDALKWMSSLNQLRQMIKKKFDETFSLEVFTDRMMHYDPCLTGYIPLEKFFDVCECFRVHLHKENMEAMMRHLKIICCDKVDYKKFVQALQFDLEFDQKLEDNPQEKLNYCTGTDAANLDHYFINNSVMRVAGIPSKRLDLKRQPIPHGQLKADRENLPSDTVQSLMHRSVFLQYGLSYREFFLPRPKEFIRKLFVRVGYNIPPEAFDDFWRKGLEIDERDDQVCVDTFYNLVKQHSEPMVKLVDELECRERRVQVCGGK